MPDPVVPNQGGTIAGFPQFTPPPQTPVGGVPIGGKQASASPEQMFEALLASSAESKGQGSIPASSFYIGKRHNSSRPYTDVEEMSAQQQTAADKIANGLGKMVGTAAQTFLSGTVGVVAGIGAMIGTGKASAFFDNDVNRALDEQMKNLDENILPNYYTRQEQDAEWYSPDNILTANFFSDKIIKNLGYSIGTIGAGIGWGSAIRAIGLTNKLVRAGRGLEAVEAVEQAIANAPKLEKFGAIQKALNSVSTGLKSTAAGALTNAERNIMSVMGAMGEASMEALQNTNEFRDNMIQKYVDEYGVRPEGQDLDEINEYASSVGNATWAMNVGILSATNYIQLPKILSSSRTAERQLMHQIEQKQVGGQFTQVMPRTKARRIASQVKNFAGLTFAPSEAFEEGAQFAIQTGVSDYFNRAYENPDQVADFFSTVDGLLGNVMSHGAEQALTTKEGLESILIGGISGGLQQMRGNIRERGFGGYGGQKQKNTDIALSSLNSSKTLNDSLRDQVGYQARAVNSQMLRNNAVLTNDKLSEKDYETDYLVSYLMPRIKYGKVDSVIEELNQYRQLVATPEGFQELQSQGIIHEGETTADFLSRISDIQGAAQEMDRTYKMITDKYGLMKDKNGKPLYPPSVIDRMVYAQAKILDYDGRLADLSMELGKLGVDTGSANNALKEYAQSAEDGYKGVLSTPSYVKAVTDTFNSMANLDVTDEVKEEMAALYYDYLEMGLRRRMFMDEYNEIKKDPTPHVTEPRPQTVTTTDEDGNTITVTPAHPDTASAKRGETTVLLKTKDFTQEFQIGKEYYLGKVVDYDKNGNEVYRFPKITILGENEDGTIKIQASNGTIRDIKQSELEDYNLGDPAALAGNKTANFYFRHINDVFEYNFGKKPDKQGISGKKVGRLLYNGRTNKLYFTYMHNGKQVAKEVDNTHFVPQGDFHYARLVKKATLVAETPEQRTAREEFTNAKEIADQEARLARTRAARISIISEMTEQSRDSLERVNKKILEKQEKLKELNSELDELRTIPDPVAKTKKQAERERRYPQQFGSYDKRFSETLRTASRTIVELARLRSDTEQEIQELQSQKEEIEFNLAYFEDFAQNINELPGDTTEFMEELKDQIDWIEEMSKETGRELNTLHALSDELKKLIADLTDFLRSAFEAFDVNYPQFMRDSFERMAQNPVFENVPQLREYISDYTLLHDTRRDIKLKEKDIVEINKQVDQLEDRLEELERESRAKSRLLDRFNLVLEQHKKAQEAEKAMAEDKALQEKLFGKQREESIKAGTEVSEPTNPDEANNKILPPARKPADILFSATVTSSQSTRPSDVRHEVFLSRIDNLPLDKQAKLRRVYLTATNEKAFGLEGLTALHLQGYVPKEGEEFIAAVYLSQEEDGYYFVDQEGNNLTKVGEKADLNQVVWASMPSTSLTDTQGDRVAEGAGDPKAIAYQEAWKQKRAQILALGPDEWLNEGPKPFYVSRGKAITDGNVNRIVGNLISEEKLASNEPVVFVSTSSPMPFQDRTIPVPPGRIVIKSGSTFQIVNNRNLTDDEVSATYQAIKEFVKQSNETKTFPPKLTRFLQGILYFQSPYSKDDEGNETKGPVGRNQIYFRGGSLFLGKNEVEIPFTTASVESHEKEIKAFLRGTYNNVNSSLLKNEPFTSYEYRGGHLIEKEWPNYQTYLLSNEGRKPEEVPLRTTVRPISPAIPNDTNYVGKYTYDPTLLNVVMPETKEEITTAPATAANPNPPVVQEAKAEEMSIIPWITKSGQFVYLPDEQVKTFDIPGLAAYRRAKNVYEVSNPPGKPKPAEPVAPAPPITPPPVVKQEVKEGEKMSKIPWITNDGQFRVLPEETIDSYEVDLKAAYLRDKRKFEANRFTAPEIKPEAAPQPTRTIPVRKDGFGKTPESQFRVTSTYDYVMADLQKEMAYIKEKTPFAVSTIENLIAAGNGIFAWGAYVNGMITLSEKMEEGTGYHEVFEGVYDVFLSPEEKNKIYKEFTGRKGSFVDRTTGKVVNYSEATPFQAKEQMAEEFRAFKLTGAKPGAPKSAIRQFFENLLSFISNILNGNIRDLNNLFARMDSGYYKGAPYKQAPTSDPQYSRTIGDRDTADTNTIVRNTVSRIFQNLFQNDKATINNLDFDEFTADAIYEKVLQSFKDYYEDILYTRYVLDPKTATMTDQQYHNQFDPVYFDILDNWSQIKGYSGELLRTFKIVQRLEDETDEHQEGDGEKHSTDRGEAYLFDPFIFDGKKNAPASIKLLIATLQESIYTQVGGAVKVGQDALREVAPDRDQSTGLERMVNYAKLFNHILANLNSANTLEEKEKILVKLSKSDPNYVRIVKRLAIGEPNLTIQDWALRIKFYNTFAKQHPIALINYLQPDGTMTIGQANLRTGSKVQTQSWLGDLKTSNKLVVPKGDNFYLKSGDIRVNLVANDSSTHFLFLDRIGIQFSSAQKANMTKDDLTNLLGHVSAIKTHWAGKEILANNLSDLGVTDRLNKIFEIFIKSANEQPESTYTNLRGERQQEFVQTNAVSRTLNDLLNSKDINELKKILPHLNRDFSNDSVYMNSVLYTKGKRNGVKMDISYVQGTFDLGENEAIPIEKLTRADRLNQVIAQNLAGNYYVLIPADSQTEWMLGMKNLYTGLSPEAMNQMWKYYQTEQTLGGSQSRVFNMVEDRANREKFERQFTSFINSEVNAQFKELSDYGVIFEKGDGTWEWTGLYKNFAESNNYDPKNLTDAQIREILTLRTVNFVANNTEIAKLFFGDLKEYKDPTKRFKSFMSPREQSLYDTPEFDAAANRHYNEVGGVRLEKGDPGYTDWRDSMSTVTLSDMITSTDLPQKGYKENNSADAQGIGTMAAYRQMMIKNGFRWSEAHEELFRYISAEDRLLMEEDGLYTYKSETLKKNDQARVKRGNPNIQRVKDKKEAITFNPLKPITSGFDTDGNPLLDKYSIFPLTYKAARGTNLAKQYKRMLDNNISYIIFESGRKVGAKGKESFYNEDGSIRTSPYDSTSLVEVPFKWFGIQVETQGSHNKTTMGSQFAKLGTVNLFDNGKALGDNAKETEDLVNEERQLREEMIEVGYQSLLKKVGINNDGTVNSEKLLKVIQDELSRRELNDNLRAALRIDENTGDFAVPLEALNNYEQIKGIIYAYVNKYIATPKLNGGPRIQVAGTGWEAAGHRIKKTTIKGKPVYTSAGLKFYTKEEPWMEVLLPAWFAKKLIAAGLDPNDPTLLSRIDEDVLKGIGFRIPTQELNSTDNFRVAGFLPDYMGDTIVVPEALTTKAGSDFDVDKLNTYLKNVYVDANGRVKAIPYFGIGAEAREKVGKWAVVAAIKGDIPVPGSREEEDEAMHDTADKIYHQSIENQYYRVLEKLLSLPQNFERLTSPNSADELKELRGTLKSISQEEFGEGQNRTIASPTFMNNIRHAFLLGKGGVGIAAVNQTNTAVVQKSQIYIDPARIANLRDPNEKEYLGNGTIALPHNTVTVDGKVYATLSSMKDQDSRFISSKNSQYIDGFVDVAKDPFVVEVGVTRSNAGTFLLLEKLGVPTDTTIFFMNQPIVREYQKLLAKAGQTFPLNSKMIKVIKTQFPVKEGQKIPTSFPGKTSSFLKGNIQSYYGDKKTMSPEENAYQHLVLDEFLKYSAMANNLFRLTQGTNYDTANFSNPYLILRKIMKTLDAERNNIFSSANKILDSTFIGKTRDALQLATDMMSDSFFKFTHTSIQPYVFPIIYEIGERFRLSDADFLKVARKVEQKFIAFLMQQTSIKSDTIPYFLLNPATATVNSVAALKAIKSSDPNSALGKNAIVNNLRATNSESPDSVKNLQIFSKSNDVFSQNLFISSMQELRDSTQNEHYEKIVATALLQSGIETSPISFSDIIPVEDFQKIMLPVIKSLNDPGLLQDFIKSETFYRNSWNNPNAVPRVKEKWAQNQWGEKYISNKMYFPAVDAAAKAAGNTDYPIYKVFRVSREWGAKFITVRPYTKDKKNQITYLLRRVDRKDGSPFLPGADATKEGKFDFAIYAPVNAWGDDVRAQEHYRTPRQSVLNNKTFKVANEMNNEMIIQLISGQIAAPTTPSAPAKPLPQSNQPVSNTPEFDKLPAKTGTTMTYAGIGSRETPKDIQNQMTALAKELEKKGYRLRTGDAKGADSAFSAGATTKSVFTAKDATERTRAIAKEIHPNPNAISTNDYILNLMARNTNQVFGSDLATPADFVIVWTKDGATSSAQRTQATGGTGQAIDMASRKGIPVINMANPNWRQELDKILANPASTTSAVSDDAAILASDRYKEWRKNSEAPFEMSEADYLAAFKCL